MHRLLGIEYSSQKIVHAYMLASLSSSGWEYAHFGVHVSIWMASHIWESIVLAAVASTANMSSIYIAHTVKTTSLPYTAHHIRTRWSFIVWSLRVSSSRVLEFQIRSFRVWSLSAWTLECHSSEVQLLETI